MENKWAHHILNNESGKRKINPREMQTHMQIRKKDYLLFADDTAIEYKENNIIAKLEAYNTSENKRQLLN